MKTKPASTMSLTKEKTDPELQPQQPEPGKSVVCKNGRLAEYPDLEEATPENYCTTQDRPIYEKQSTRKAKD